MSINQKYVSFSQPRDLRLLFWGEDKLLTPLEARRRLKITKTVQLSLVNRHKLKVLKLSCKTWRYWLSDLIAYATNL